jgi:ribosomal protein S18 acetylase RimI-like enzyme
MSRKSDRGKGEEHGIGREQREMALRPIVEQMTELTSPDLEQLCAATEDAILDGNGFGWLVPPPRSRLEKYWQGVLLVPQRELYIARLAARIVGAAQLVKPTPNNEAGAHNAAVETFFIAPQARGHGLARGLLSTIEGSAKRQGIAMLDFHVRATQTAAISLVESHGYRHWATRRKFAKLDDSYVDGMFFVKDMEETEDE